MLNSNTEFQEFVKSEIKKYKGVYVPVKASKLERRLVKKLSCKKLHPNPADEFCFEKIGPSFRIISEYEKKFRHALSNGEEPFDDRLIVEKMSPDGYLLLNGHHRWAAAMKVDIKRVPVEIVNITHEADIKKMLGESTREKRVTFDLDEVIFAQQQDDCEQMKKISVSGAYKERIRLGVPALFHFFHTLGYDVWVFSSNYYSMEYIQKLFRKYSVSVDGIVTGTSRKTEEADQLKKIDDLMSKKYKETVNVDNEQVVRIIPSIKDFEQYELKGRDGIWSESVMNVVEGFGKNV